jgi:hypothetical protein
MGQPVQGDAWTPAAESIGRAGGSRGTETSQYPDQEKSKEIPQVVASERGAAQTSRLRTAGVVGAPTSWLRAADPKVLEGTTRDGESPVGEPPVGSGCILSTTNPGEFVGSRGDHPPRLNTFSDR